MKIKYGIYGLNGNAEGYIEFQLQVVRDGKVAHTQTFRNRWMVVNASGLTENDLKLELIRQLFNHRLPQLFDMLEVIVKEGRGVDDSRQACEFEPWEWRIE